MTAAMSRAWSLVLAVFALAAIAIAPSLAAAAPRWLAPTELTPAGERASSPRVVIGPDGASTAAWVAQTPAGGVVRVARRPAGVAAWPAPVDVSAPGASGIVDLAVDPVGAVAIMWTSPAAGPPGTVALTAAVRPADGAFGAPEQVPGPSAGSLFTAFAADGAGGFVAAWSGPLTGGQSSTAYASTRAPGGGWSPAEALSAPGEHALAYGASGAGGRVAVVWTGATLGSVQRAVKVRERTTQGGPWAPEGVAAAAAGSVLNATVAVGPAGELLATWFTDSDTGSVVQAASRPAGGAWGPAETLGAGGTVPPKALIEPDGTASVVWSGDGVVARVRPPGAGFGPPQALSSPGAPNGPLSATLGAAGPAGGVIAAWAAGGSSPGGLKVIRSAIKPAGSAQFGPVSTVSAPAGTGAQAAALGPGGEGVAVWLTTSDAIGTAGALRTADYTERPGAALEPSPVAVRIDHAPRTAIEGTMIRLKLAADGFADGLPVRLQQKFRGAFRDMGPVVRVSGQTAELPLRLAFPGKLVVRLAYESQGKPAFSRSATVLISRPAKPLSPAGTSPSRVAVGLGGVWVLTKDDAGRAVVLRLDRRNGRATAGPIPVEGASGLAVGAGAVWVSRGVESDRGVVRIDPATAKVAAEVPVITSGALAAGPAGVWTVECVRRSGFGLGCGEQHLARIDPAVNAVSERITVVGASEDFEPRAAGLAVGSRYVWFTVFRDRSTITRRLDTRTGKIAPDVGLAAGLVARGEAVWGFSGRTCSLVSGRGAGQLVSRGQVAGRPRFGCSSLVSDGRSVWVVQGANTFGIDPASVRVPARLVRLDARTARQVGRPIALGAAPAAVDVDAGVIWAASGDEGVIRRIVPPRAGARPPATRPHRTPRPRAAWRRPATIAGSSATTISGLDLAVGDRGRAAAIWKAAPQRGAPSVVSAVRAAGAAGWTPARRMGQAATNVFTGSPRVEMNAAGEAAAVWTGGGSSLAASSAQAALLGARARAWSAPATLGEPGTGNLDPDVGIAADGTALATWTCLCGGGGTVIRTATRPPDGAFGAPAALGDAGTTALTNAHLAMSPGGQSLAAWAPFPGGGLTVAARPAGGDFGLPVALVPPVVIGATEPRIAVNGAGRAVAVWQADGLFARLRGADGAWGATERIAPPGNYSFSGPQLAIDAAGDLLVAVRAFDLETYNFRVMVIARRAGAAAWERPAWISPKGPVEGPPGPSAGEPSLAMNARGDAVVAWPQTIAGAPRALARLRPAGRLAWRPLEAVSGRERGVGAVSATIDAEGAHTAAWVSRAQGNARSRTVVRVAARAALRPAA